MTVGTEHTSPQKLGVMPDMFACDDIVTDPMTVEVFERVRLILRGGSIVDWYRMGFTSVAEVRSFLAVNGFDTNCPDDVRRVRHLFRMAHDYLSEALDVHVPQHIWEPEEIEYPFLIASDFGTDEQPHACILLKLVHTINHLEARELRHNLPLPDMEIFEGVETRVFSTLGQLIQLGAPIVQFKGGRKTRGSTITKLLSKRRATAAEILDRLRFRILVEAQDDIPRALAYMTQKLLPYNYIIPEESTNDILNVRNYMARTPGLTNCEDAMQFDLTLEETDPLRRPYNECSAKGFRMLNFVADLPVRIDHVLERSEYAHLKSLGRIIFVTAEFQIFDQRTWDWNEEDDMASHGAYKDRQRERVKERLERGLPFHNNARKSKR
jgi:uncharacterized protein (TIGR04552 family)